MAILILTLCSIAGALIYRAMVRPVLAAFGLI